MLLCPVPAKPNLSDAPSQTVTAPAELAAEPSASTRVGVNVPAWASTGHVAVEATVSCASPAPILTSFVAVSGTAVS